MARSPRRPRPRRAQSGSSPQSRILCSSVLYETPSSRAPACPVPLRGWSHAVARLLLDLERDRRPTRAAGSPRRWPRSRDQVAQRRRCCARRRAPRAARRGSCPRARARRSASPGSRAPHASRKSLAAELPAELGRDGAVFGVRAENRVKRIVVLGRADTILAELRAARGGARSTPRCAT